jgi:hypothetical protein
MPIPAVYEVREKALQLMSVERQCLGLFVNLHGKREEPSNSRYIYLAVKRPIEGIGRVCGRESMADVIGIQLRLLVVVHDHWRHIRVFSLIFHCGVGCLVGF